MNVERKDFIHQIEDYSTGSDLWGKGPGLLGKDSQCYRHCTPQTWHLQGLNLTQTESASWVTFGYKWTVSEKFILSVQNVNGKDFDAFPYIQEAMKRNDTIIEILKRLTKLNLHLWYQVRLGKGDLEVRLKNHFKNAKMDLGVIDPNETVPEGDLTGKYINPPREATIVNPFDHLKKPGKRGTKTSK